MPLRPNIAARPTHPKGPRSARALVEALEQRSLLSASWTAEEVYLLELVNRARYDPWAEGARLGLDLAAGLTAAELLRLVPSEPLAFNEFLTNEARAHAADMGTRDFFAHINPDGLDPDERAAAAGYDGKAGENIGAGYVDIDAVHLAWLASVTHRKNVLSLHDDFDASFHYAEFGAGTFYPSTSVEYTSYYVQEYGVPGAAGAHVVGVVFDDANSNGFYTMGEGHSNVLVEVLAAGGAVVGSYTTDAAGNYQIAVPDGGYTVRFTDLWTSNTSSVEIRVEGQNVKVDALGTSLAPNYYSFSTAMPMAVVSGSPQPGDLLTVATLDRAGRFITFTQTGPTSWYRTDVTSATGAPRPTGPVSTWTVPGDPNTYAAAPSAAGLIIYTRDTGASWTYRNLTIEFAGASSITGSMTTYVDKENASHVAGLNANGELVLYSDLLNGSWWYSNLTTEQLVPQGQTMPLLTGPLISYVTAWGGQNIAGLDSLGHIQSIWWAPGLSMWRTDDLSAITGAPAMNGGLTVYLTDWGGINLAGSDSSGNVTATWWVPDFQGNWVTTNLTQAYGGPTLQSFSLSSYTTSWGGLNIVGLDQYDQIVVYWWAPGMNSWSASPITAIIPDATAPYGPIRGVASWEGTINLLGVRNDGHVLRYHWTIGGDWLCDDLTIMV